MPVRKSKGRIVIRPYGSRRGVSQYARTEVRSINSKPLTMSRRFAIVNGDDFGFSLGVNQGIIQAHEQGILTSASLMVTGDAFDEAVSLAKSHPNLGVGLHLVLVCGKSALLPSQIPHLVDKDGLFPSDPVKAGLRYQFDRLARQELKQEIRAQLEKFRQTGLPLAHVDGHLHLHSHPVVLRILVELAEEFSIEIIRLPSEELRLTLDIDPSGLAKKVIASLVFTWLRKYGEALLKAKKIGFAERVYGLLQTGNISEEYLLQLIGQIGANTIEIYTHPAIDETTGAKNQELIALLSDRVREKLLSNYFEIVNYKTLRVN
jgi:chitin disaccharide deacetylase